MTTHAELLAAIDGALDRPVDYYCEGEIAHLATLRALVNLHEPGTPTSRGSYCTVCLGDLWPCPTVAIVIDALRTMGVAVDG